MSEGHHYILKTRRFFPLLLTQFLGVLNDNVFRYALTSLVTFRIASEYSADDIRTLVTIAVVLFISPYVFFSSMAGALAERYQKEKLIRIAKIAELVIMAAGALGLFWGNIPFLLLILFLMGAQSTFHSPARYAILPDLLKKKELISGNGYIEAITFIAILIGTLYGSTSITWTNGITIASISLLSLAGIGIASSLFIPQTKAGAPDLRLNWNLYAATMDILRHSASQRRVFMAILGISWFWGLGSVFLAQFPSYAKDYFGGDASVFALFLGCFSIGIAVGAILCDRVLRSEISPRLVPWGALGVTVFTLDLFLSSPVPVGEVANAELVGWIAFLGEPSHYRTLIDMLGIAAFGGLFTVPLYAMVQHESKSGHRSRNLASNNILNALFIVAMGAIVVGLIEFFSVSIPGIFLIMGIANLIIVGWLAMMLPDTIVKSAFAAFLRTLFRVRVKGVENYKAVKGGALIISNHVSFLDGVLLATFLPGRPSFAVNTDMTHKWWAKPFLMFVEVFSVDPTNPMATKGLVKAIRDGKKVVVFPEGRLTNHGGLMKIYEGPAMVAERAKAKIIPVRIDGAEFSRVTRIKDIVKSRFFPRIRITIDEPVSLKGTKDRQKATIQLHDIMVQTMYKAANAERTLFEALLDAAKDFGKKKKILEDIKREPLSYKRLIIGSIVLGRAFRDFTEPRENVGLLLPNASAMAVAFFGLHAYERVPALLNYTLGLNNIRATLKAAKIKTVITSRQFVDAADLKDLVDGIAVDRKVFFLEDLRDEIGLSQKLAAMLITSYRSFFRRQRNISPDDTAAILFTSGSEGTPKGVVLSHKNFLSNVQQFNSVIDINPSDVMFACLPAFHSFGLTGGILLPLLNGIKTFLYPSPLHYRVVPEYVYDTHATLLFGTDTFLSGYARVAHPYDFRTVRYVVAGAEKLKEETRRAWMDKFGIRIMEGYGVTETAPALACNTPFHYKAGTVGRFVPGIEYKLEDVEGIKDGGRLHVKGPNVMKGYLFAEEPGKLKKPKGGYHDTGDIVRIDEQGYITILGRAKRFAKIGGEMVSLTAVENHIHDLWPDNTHAVIAIEDKRKGERLMLVTDKKDAERSDIVKYFKEKHLPEIMVPKALEYMKDIPLLGTGKVNYRKVQEEIKKEQKEAA